MIIQPHPSKRWAALGVCLAACVNSGVTTDETEGDGSGSESPIDVSSAPARGGPNQGAVDDGLEPTLDGSPSLDDILRVTDASSVADGVARTNRFRRLTLDEYDRSVRDLLGFDAGAVSNEFPEELPTLAGYFARGDLRVSDRLIVELQNAAGRLAERLVGDAAALGAVVGCTTRDAACRDTFLSEFGLRVYRRPLSPAELERYRALFDGAGEALGTGDAFRDGVQLSVEAMLQSPHFLYRVEHGSGEVDEHGERITGYEAATRLSYMLWGSTPDSSLLDAAASGELATSEGVAAHAERLISDGRVADRVLDYHSRWLQLDAMSAGGKDPSVFPEYGPELLTSMLDETRRFIEETTLTDGGALTALLTASHTFVDARLAALYGVPGEFGSELERVDLGAGGERAGLLTQAAFLSGHSSSSDRTSPILRGVFVLRRLLCQDIPDPPPNAQAMEPPASQTPIVTTRDFFAWKTSMVQCRSCHFQINPAGFAFEDFDAIGRHRTQEAGAPIDATGVLNLAGGTLEFEGGKQFAAAIAERPEARACYAQNWLRYLWGRADTDADLRTLTTIRQGLGAPSYGVRELLRDVTRSAAFLHLVDDGG